MTRYFCILPFLFFSLFLFSQEQLGIRLENYAGINGVSLNPTATLSYPHRWHLNVFGIGAFVDNSYGFVSNSTVVSLVRNEKEIQLGPEIGTNRPSNIPVADFYDTNRKKYVATNFLVLGPALSFKINQNHAVGIFYNARFAASVMRIPKVLGFYVLDRTPYRQDVTISPFDGAVMQWDELGLNYAGRAETQNGYFQFGTTLKYLRGYEAFFARANETFKLARFPKDSLRLSAPDISYGFTNANFKNIADTTYRRQAVGTGFGLDIGASYLIAEEENTYILKLSAALLDIGSIAFGSQSEEHRIRFDQTKIITGKPFEKAKSPQELVKILSYETNLDSNKTFVRKGFSIGLPTAFSFQADYQFLPNAYANITWVQRMPFQENPIRRGNLFAVSARYEHRWFGASVPLVFYEYQRARLGFALRAAGLTIGTDYLGSFARKNNFTGTDFYIVYKINPLDLNIGKPNLFGGFGKRNKNVECYKF